jgi:peptidyl-prolyl cis-trans isomerase C
MFKIFKGTFKQKGGYFMRKYLWVLGLLILTVIVVHGKALAQNDDVLAKIGGKKITISDFNRILGYFDSERQKMLEKNPQLKETILRQLVQGMVVSELAKKAGFDKRPEIKKQLDFFKDNFLANEFLKTEVADKMTVSEDDMKSYYDTHQDEFKTPEMVRTRHILIKIDTSASEEDKKKAKEKAKEKAEDILGRIHAGEDFAKLASDLSDDPVSKSKGGDLGFFAKGMMVKSFEEAAFALKPGEVSGIVESPFGYHIIKLEERKDSAIEPYDIAKETINQKLLQDLKRSKVSEFIDKAMKDAGVEIHPELITGSKK